MASSVHVTHTATKVTSPAREHPGKRGSAQANWKWKSQTSWDQALTWSWEFLDFQ